jgi:hypothetical protein
MRRKRISWMLVVTALPTVLAAASQKQTDVPLTLTFHRTAQLSNWDGTVTGSTVPSAVAGDSSGDLYTNDTTIKFASGTFDAVLNLLVGKRYYSWILPAPIAGTGGLPQTPSPGTYTGLGVINIRNILCQGCTAQNPGYTPGTPFVTRVSVDLSQIGLNGSKDGYTMWYGPLTDETSLIVAPDYDNGESNWTWANSPNPTAWAVVLPQPYNCALGVYPWWIVRATLPNTRVAGAASYTALGSLWDHTLKIFTGDFVMPFEIQLQAQKCFNPGY